VNRHIRDPVGELASAAETLRLDRALSLAVQAMSAGSQRGLALAFTRSGAGGLGSVCAAFDGEMLQPEELGRPAPFWIVDIDAVPSWQRDRWVEPMHAGVHGPAYFSDGHPVKGRFHWRTPDYGRVMICHGGRLVAWAGLLIDGTFRDGERESLREVASAIALPLKLAALCAEAPAQIELSPRQRQIMDGVARGRTNKQIAHDLDISPATVKTILERLFRISGASNRAGLVAWARGPVRNYQSRPNP
jgi:DNA-binding CsgD family transcriptional regulator